MEEGTAGTRNDRSVLAAIDLVPSLLHLAVVKGPEDVSYDGEDLLATLLGQAETSRAAPVYFSRPPDRKNFYGFENLPDLAVRDGRWKLLCDDDGGRPQLYDLEADPGESDNLADQYPGITRELVRNSVHWWQSVRKPEKSKIFIP
jgi:uncharacterized sulfatase